ncbi:MAG: hypothetical protein N3A69_00445 [Leptospiraceae bacterium]|nr:hypothetical protein [Leptospiraceae bacterium]
MACLLVSGVYDSKDSLLAINLAETNKHITVIHELAYWLYDNYSFLQDDKELQNLIEDYKSKFRGKVKYEHYYLKNSDIFSRLIEFKFAKEKKRDL